MFPMQLEMALHLLLSDALTMTKRIMLIWQKIRKMMAVMLQQRHLPLGQVILLGPHCPQSHNKVEILSRKFGTWLKTMDLNQSCLHDKIIWNQLHFFIN
jgi:hypothetical protein